MYVEYCNYNKYIEDYGKELSQIFTAIDAGLNGLALPIHMIREFKEYSPEGVVLAAPIDFPCGYSSTKARNFMVLNSVQSGANAIDYVPNQYMLRNKFTELAKEIETSLRICNDYGATLRIFLDYHHCSSLISVARMYYDLGVEIAFPTFGYHHDDFVDNIVNSKIIETKTEMSTIFNGYVWRQDQLDTINKAEIFGLRLYDLKLWCNKEYRNRI